MKVALVDDWKRAWRMLSVIVSALLFVLSMVQAELLPVVQPLVPPSAWPLVSAGFAVAIVLVRIVKQGISEATRPTAEATRQPGSEP